MQFLADFSASSRTVCRLVSAIETAIFYLQGKSWLKYDWTGPAAKVQTTKSRNEKYVLKMQFLANCSASFCSVCRIVSAIETAIFYP